MHTLFRKSLILFLCTSAVLILPAVAQDIEVKRTVLAVYDSTEWNNPGQDDNYIHSYAEMPLNYLGCKVKYHDINTGIPHKEDLKDVRAVMTWFKDDVIKDADGWARWIKECIKEGKYYILMGNPGFYTDKETGEYSEERVVEVFRLLGFDYAGGELSDPIKLREVYRSNLMGFERDPADEMPTYINITAREGNSVKNHYVIERIDSPDSESSVVAASEKGGFALEGYALYLTHHSGARWYLNPFEFFEQALALKNTPVYDTTTLLGNRMLYIHIDGDGYLNKSELGEDVLSGELIYEDFLKKYKLPTTVSFIQAEIDPDLLGSERAVKGVKAILTLPYIEPAVHTFSHPLDWRHQVVSYEVPGYSRKLALEEIGDLEIEQAYRDFYYCTLPREAYLKKEVLGSVNYINSLAPQDKPVSIFLWSGNTAPDEWALKLLDRINIPNMNGGDPRMDRFYPTYTALSPLARQQTDRIQVYTSAPNENIYTDGWKKFFDGFKHVTQTFDATERGIYSDGAFRRVSPVNIYYHFYIAEKEPAYRSLEFVYEDVAERQLIPVYASHYAKVVQGFFAGRIERIGEAWKFTEYGNCRTVRMNADGREPDMRRSIGIQGFRKVEDTLYIHLAPGSEALLYFTDKNTAPYLVYADSVIEEITIEEDRIRYQVDQINASEYLFNFFRSGKYRLLLNDKEVFIHSKDGLVAVKLSDAFSGQIEVGRL